MHLSVSMEKAQGEGVEKTTKVLKAGPENGGAGPHEMLSNVDDDANDTDI